MSDDQPQKVQISAEEVLSAMRLIYPKELEAVVTVIGTAKQQVHAPDEVE